MLGEQTQAEQQRQDQRERFFRARDQLLAAGQRFLAQARREADDDRCAWLMTYALRCQERASQVTQWLARHRTWRDDPTRF